VAESGDFEEAAKTVLEEAAGTVAGAEDGPLVRNLVVHGIPAQVLLDASAEADLLVVGSRGLGGFGSALLGSVGQHCVHHAHCPVVVMRGRS
jgi:nucleotide-binding universal stress UspA family protein